jgi:hypothetical protein
MDERKRILLLAVGGAAVLSLLCLILPENLVNPYIVLMKPLTLFIGFIFALQVASIYTGDLRKSFLFLSFFLLIYTLVNIIAIGGQPLIQFLISIIGESGFSYILLLVQIIDYAMLLGSCSYTVKVIDVKRMNRYGWAFITLLTPLCAYIVYHSSQLKTAGNVVEPVVAVILILINVIDMAVVLMLVPVLSLYLQYLKAKAQESITFTFIMGGLILNFFPVYIVELFAPATRNLEGNPAMNAAYLFSYLIMAIGLYANRKYDEWGFKMIEKALR